MTSPISTVTPCVCGNLNCEIPFGVCHCGCKRRTEIAAQNWPKYGHVKGKPYKYFRGHRGGHLRQDTSEFGHFKIDGVYCRLIALTKELYAIVDESDYGWVSQFLWYAAWIKGMQCFYAARHLEKRCGGKGKVVYMHREILGFKRGDAQQVDHVDVWATLKNRRRNLRPSSTSQNGHNMRRHRRNTTGHKNIYWENRRQHFIICGSNNGKRVYAGCSKTIEGAIEIRKRFALTRGEFDRD